MERIKLDVFGLTYSQTQAGAYALVLSIENSKQRIPIIIGGFEAQAIAIHLENMTPPRPLTHDIFFCLATEFGIKLNEVFIYKLEEGIFYSKLYFEKDGEIKSIDSRTSDAVSLALRFGCPIYTTYEIVEKSGIDLDFKDFEDSEENSNLLQDSQNESSKFFNFSDNDLKILMDEAIMKEDYETASILRDELNRRKKEQ